MSIEPASQDLLHELFAAVDAQDIDRFLGCIADDATFRFGSTPPVAGHTAIRGAVDGFFGTIAGVQHELTRTVEDGATLVCEGEVTYTRHDDSQLTLPFANIFELESGLISDYKIYIDIAPLYVN